MSDETVETPAEEPQAAEAPVEAPVEAVEPAPAAPEVKVEEASTEEPKKRSAKKAAPAYPAMAVTSGAAHDAICEAQKKLGVAETCVVDADTKAAVKALQKKSGMKADGVMSAAVWAKIFA